MPDTHEQLKNWGKAVRQPPSRNEALKSEILSKAPVVSRFIGSDRRRIPWLSFAFAAAAIIVFLLPTRPSLIHKDMPASVGSGGFAVPEHSELSAPSDSIWNKILPNPYSSPITDTREFLKTNYYSTLRTRRVSEMTGRVQTIVRGFGGRVDGASSSEKSGHVSFAVPADKFEMFRQEVKSLVGAKLYTEQTYSENLLPQKQSIEEQMAAAWKNLDNLKADRDALIAAHKKTFASLNAQLNSVLKERAAISAEDPRQTELAVRENNLRIRIGNENKDYQSKLASYDQQVRQAEDNLVFVQKQDQNLIDNVATVNGTISLQWISLWEVLDLFLPGPALAWLLAAAAVAAYFWRARPLPLP